jgi:hypothetical protein
LSNQAQDQTFNPQVNWNEKVSPAKGRYAGYHFLKGDENVVYYFYKTGTPAEDINTGDYIVKHDIKTNTVTNLKVELKNKKSVEREFESIELINDKIYLFSSFNNKKHQKYYFFSETINTDPLAYNYDEQMIAEIDYSTLKGGKVGNFNVSLSPDGSHLLLSYFLLNKKNLILSFGLNLLDREMNVLFSHTNDFTEMEKGAEVWYGTSIVDNAGNIYFSSRIDQKKQRKLFITLYPSDGSEAKVMEIPLSEGKNVLAEKLTTNNDNQLVCAGFYTSVGIESASGVFSALFTPSFDQAPIVHEMNFSNDLLTKGLSDKEAQNVIKEKEKGKDFDDDYNYLFEDQVHFRKDGGFDIIAEKYKRILYTQTQWGAVKSTTKSYFHYYDDIFICSYKKDGSINWLQKIPRNQRLTNWRDALGSYSVHYDENEQIRIFYSDIQTNFLMEVNQAQPLLITYDMNGKESLITLFTGDENKDVRQSLMPQFLTPLGNSTYLFSQVHFGKMFGNSSLQLGVAELK